MIKKCLKKIPLISILTTGLELASDGYSDRTPGYRRKQQWKIFLYVTLNPFFSSYWFSLFKSPKFNVISLNRPRLFMKPFRPF